MHANAKQTHYVKNKRYIDVDYILDQRRRRYTNVEKHNRFKEQIQIRIHLRGIIIRVFSL